MVTLSDVLMLETRSFTNARHTPPGLNRLACFAVKETVAYKRGITPARKDLLTDETATRSFPDMYAKINSSTSRFRLSAVTIGCAFGLGMKCGSGSQVQPLVLKGRKKDNLLFVQPWQLVTAVCANVISVYRSHQNYDLSTNVIANLLLPSSHNKVGV